MGANIQQGMAIYRKPQGTLPEFSIGNWCASPANAVFSSDTFCLQPFDRTRDLEILEVVQRGEGWDECSQVWMRFSSQVSSELPPNPRQSRNLSQKFWAYSRPSHQIA